MKSTVLQSQVQIGSSCPSFTALSSCFLHFLLWYIELSDIFKSRDTKSCMLCMHNPVSNANEGVLATRSCKRDLGVSWDTGSKSRECTCVVFSLWLQPSISEPAQSCFILRISVLALSESLMYHLASECLAVPSFAASFWVQSRKRSQSEIFSLDADRNVRESSILKKYERAIKMNLLLSRSIHPICTKKKKGSEWGADNAGFSLWEMN